MGVDIFKAWGELSPDVEGFDLSCCCISASGGDVHHPKNAAWSLFYVLKCFMGFKVFFLMGSGSFISCEWLVRAFLTWTGLLCDIQVLRSRLDMATQGRDRITVWQEGRPC